MELNEKQKKQDELSCRIMEAENNLYHFVLNAIPIGGHRNVSLLGEPLDVPFGDHYVTIKEVCRESQRSLYCLIKDEKTEWWAPITDFGWDMYHHILPFIELT